MRTTFRMLLRLVAHHLPEIWVVPFHLGFDEVPQDECHIGLV